MHYDEKGNSDHELEIFGVGIIGFRSNRIFTTETVLNLFLPNEILFVLRKRIFHIKDVEKRNKILKRHIK